MRRIAGGSVGGARSALTSVAPAALRATQAELELVGRALSDATVEAAAQAVRAACDPADDLRGHADYKRAMAGEMARRAIRAAAARCK